MIEDGPEGSTGSSIHDRVREMARGWDHREEDLSRLLDRVASSMAEEANHELRQILTHVLTQLELAGHRTSEPGASLDQGTLEELLEAIERAARVVETHLERREIAKSLIRLDRQRVDLERLLARYVEREPIDPERDDVHLDTEPAPVRADREKLSRVLGFLVSWFGQRTSEEHDLLVEVAADDGKARCFVGVDPCTTGREKLMQRLVEPLTIDDLEVDIPYVRAVVERHGGVVYVGERPPGFRGYSIEIPAEVPP